MEGVITMCSIGKTVSAPRLFTLRSDGWSGGRARKPAACVGSADVRLLEEWAGLVEAALSNAVGINLCLSGGVQMIVDLPAAWLAAAVAEAASICPRAR